VDLAVLCHTLHREKAASIGAEARELWPEARLIQLSKFRFGLHPIPSYADAVVPCGSVFKLFSVGLELLGPAGKDQSSSSAAGVPDRPTGPVLLPRTTHSK
jgi:hypothetical protein